MLFKTSHTSQNFSLKSEEFFNRLLGRGPGVPLLNRSIGTTTSLPNQRLIPGLISKVFPVRPL
jgi:hypothetical protein